MSYSVDVKNQLATFQFEISPENFAHELEKEIFRSKDKMNVSVYRDGQVPPEVIQQMYDRNELVKRVINTVIGIEYEAAMKESNYIGLTPPMAKVINCKKGEPFTFTCETVIKPEIQIGTYTEIEVAKPDFTVPESDVDKVVKKFLQQHARTIDITDRTVEDGDHVFIDFEGFLHGRPFKGNKADNFPLTIGSHSFIPGFEEELIGIGVGEFKDFTITYPEDYRIETLAGQDVVFRCIVRRITQIDIPELDDEFVMNNTQFDSVDTYRTNVRKTLELQKKVFELKKKENFVLKAIVESSTFDIPERLYAFEEKRIEAEQEAQFKKRGITLEKHLKMHGQTEEVYRKQIKTLASNRIRTRLLLLDISKREQLDVSEIELNNEIARLAKSLNKSEESLSHPFSKQQIGNEIRIQKALRFVMEHAVEITA